MKKIILSFVFICLFSRIYALDAALYCAAFYSQDKPFVEVNIEVIGQTLGQQILPTKKLQCGVQVLILVKQGDKIVTFDKYNLRGQQTQSVQNLLDIRRFALNEGTYTIVVEFEDLADPNNKASREKTLTIAADKSNIWQSDIVLLQTFKADSSTTNPLVKNGYYMEPLTTLFYNKTATNLMFYNELYNVKEDVAVSYYITKSINGQATMTNIIGQKKVKPQAVGALLLQLDISKLGNGFYTLNVDVRNRLKQMLSQKTVTFDRSNPYLYMDVEDNVSNDALEKEFVAKLDTFQLRYSLKAISCKMRGDDASLLNRLVKEHNTQAQRRFLFRYWAVKNPNNPETAYNQYMEVAKAVDEMYKTGFGYGFETDRGYIYLKYGRPDDILTVENDAVAPPYEMWRYNDFPMTNQKNIKFLFYNQTLVANDFRLLHSNARGELSNPRWKTVLYGGAKDQQIGNSIDGTDMQDNFGRNASRLLEEF